MGNDNRPVPCQLYIWNAIKTLNHKKRKRIMQIIHEMWIFLLVGLLSSYLKFCCIWGRNRDRHTSLQVNISNFAQIGVDGPSPYGRAWARPIWPKAHWFGCHRPKKSKKIALFWAWYWCSNAHISASTGPTAPNQCPVSKII